MVFSVHDLVLPMTTSTIPGMKSTRIQFPILMLDCPGRFRLTMFGTTETQRAISYFAIPPRSLEPDLPWQQAQQKKDDSAKEYITPTN